MVLSLLAVLAVPAAAIDGDWIVYSKADHYEEDFADPMSIPGYEYNDEGLRIISADWRDFRPGAGMQTKEKLDIKEGVYMKVRIDEFNYESDHWFNFHIYSRAMMKAGQSDVEKWGYGFQELIRYRPSTGNWAIEWAIGGYQRQGATPIDPSNISMDENGVVELELKVTWDGSTFALSINDTPAPQAVIDYMNEIYTKEDAYVGFNFQNSTVGGKCGCTVLAFGTSEELAVRPMGDDSREPENFYKTISEIADPSTVAEGQPAIYLNGNRTESDAKMVPSVSGGLRTINDDYSIHVAATTSTPYVNCEIKNAVSYDIDDFPVAMVVTKNFCVCGEDECMALESCNMYLMAGEALGASAENKVSELDMSYDPIFIGEDSYLYFFYDFSEEGAPFDAEGRINGVRFDFIGVDAGTAGANVFDVMFAAFFRNAEDAEAYAMNYFKELGYVEAEETTEAPTETDEADTAAPVEGTDAPEKETNAPAEGTDAPEKETNAPEKETSAPVEETDAPEKETDTPTAAGGCGSVVGFGAITVIALVAACGAITFKKKD